jgi:hypothetical protein
MEITSKTQQVLKNVLFTGHNTEAMKERILEMQKK